MWPVPTANEISDLDVSLGAKLHAFPRMDEIPKEFHDHNNKFCMIASTLFFSGGKLQDHGLAPRKGVDRIQAFRAIKAFLCSFEPKHEHKTAAVGYLLSEWYEPHNIEHESPHRKQTVN